MRPFRKHRGIAVALLRINVDTDAIIPSREIKAVSKRGLAEGLFAGWRYKAPDAREPDPGFVLNQPQFAGASILLSGANFGCGSSREQAVWALAEYGFRCIVAPSFGAIFHNNCIRNGLLPLVLPDETIKDIATLVEANPQNAQLDIDLEACELTAPDGNKHRFELDEGQRRMLLEGIDPIGLTLKQQDVIDAHIARDREARPWAYLDER